MPERLTTWLWLLAIVALLASPALAQSDDEQESEDATQPVDRPALQAGALPLDYRFDGRPGGPAWRAATDSIANLVTVEPEEGDDPAGQTIIKVFANERDIVVAARCYDADPDAIVSYSKARDSELEEEDHIMIVFDTFLDGRSGYVFAVNPDGSRFDALVVAQGEEINSNWDALWEARTSRDASGWNVEIRIPIKSLGFKKSLREWGFNIQRRVQRLQETSRWSGASQDFEISQTTRAGVLTHLPRFDFGVGFSVRPAAVGRLGKPEQGEDTEFDGDLSLDMTQKLGPNLLSALTVNTDFAETEVDARKVNLTRFELFFPEKRTFFLEGADIFEFGAGLDEENVLPFFSRRIGLFGEDADDQLEIPVNVGGKINGRIGNTNIGALVVNTRETDVDLEFDVEVEIAEDSIVTVAVDSTLVVPNTTMAAMRISHNVLEESSVGVLATYGDQFDRADSWSAGVDFTYRTSSFLDEKNFLIGAWGMLNDREGLDGDKSAFGFRVDYPNDLFDVNLTSIRIGDGFAPSLGFVPRNDVHIWDFGGEFSPRPGWGFVRQTFYELSATVFADRDNSSWQSYEATVKPIDWLLESGDRLEVSVEPQGDKPPQPFEIADDVDLPPSAEFEDTAGVGAYEWLRYAVGVRTAKKRRLIGDLRYEFGEFYNGDLKTIEGSVALRPSAFVTLEFTAERNDGTVDALTDDFEETGVVELVEKEFTEELYGVRLQLNFSPDLQLTTFTQYDNESREMGSFNRLRWTFLRNGDLFVVYNHNLLRNDDDEWLFVSNQLPVKIQYNWRF